jgi:hypothetical protein
LVGALLICAVGIVVYGPHVLRGGFAADDWVDYSRYLFHPGSGFWAAVAHHQGIYRPLWALISDLGWALMGANPVPHLLQNLVVALVESILLFAVARNLGVSLVAAVAMGLLLLLFPDADSTRLFPTDVQMALASALFLGGLLVGLRGANTPGSRGMVLGLLALLLYTLSILDYELTAPTALLAGALCILRAWRRGTGWLAWSGLLAVECVVVGLLLLHRAAGHAPDTTLQQDLAHAAVIARQAVVVTERAAVPFPVVTLRSLLFPLALAVVLLATAVAALARGRTLRPLPQRDLAGLILGLAVVVTGYVMIIPGASGYMPDSAGMQNRVNAVAAIGLAVAVVSLISLTATLLIGWLPWRRPAASILVLLAAGWVVAGDTLRTSQHAAHWEQAAREQSEVLAILDRAVPPPRDGLTVFAFARSGYTAPAVPIFGGGGMGDMVGALRVTWMNGTTRGYPVLDQMHVDCQPVSILVDGILDSRTHYGRAVFVDLRRGTATVPADAKECRSAADAALPYAPVNETELSDLGS